MKVNINKIWIMMGVVLLANMAYAGDPLKKAHEAYARQNFKVMTAEIKNALIANPNDELIRKNAMGLLEKAYEISVSKLPMDWTLPEQITSLKVVVQLKERDSKEYSMRIGGSTIEPDMIDQLQVIQYPDIIILDKKEFMTAKDDSHKKNKKGQWEEWADKTSGPSFSLQGKKSKNKIPTGLYLLNITLRDGTVTNGYFFIDETMNSTAVPTVTSPSKNNQTFALGNPVVSFANFFSPQYRSSEKRSIYIGVSDAKEPYENHWSIYQDSVGINNVTIGATPGGEGVSQLEPGSYVVNVQYREKKKLGDLILARDSISARPFSIQK